ncbi:MAG: MFS transporter [Candidatus Omnitrophica bacterium]|nr:MFS transporter [Candidatus Omnitrophota bacterium]
MSKNKSLTTIFLIVFVDLLGFGIILPLLPFIAQRYSASPFAIGFLTATYSLFQFISSPILGKLSDKYGRKRLLIISQTGSMIGYLILAFASNLPLIFLARIVDGITGGNISIAQAYIADITKKENRAKGMGLIGAAFGLGFIFGPAIGALLSKISFSAPALLAALVSLITVFSTKFFLEETTKTQKLDLEEINPRLKDIITPLRTFPLNIIIIAFFLVNLTFSSFQGIFPLYSEKIFNFGPQENGWVFTYIGILVVIVQLKVMPFFVSKLREEKVMKIGLFCLSVGLLLIPISKNITLLALFMILLPIGNGFFNPTIQAIASEQVKKTKYGQTLGLMQSSGSIGRILGPIIASGLFTLSPTAPFYFSFIVTFLLFILINKKHSS